MQRRQKYKKRALVWKQLKWKKKSPKEDIAAVTTTITTVAVEASPAATQEAAESTQINSEETVHVALVSPTEDNEPVQAAEQVEEPSQLPQPQSQASPSPPPVQKEHEQTQTPSKVSRERSLKIHVTAKSKDKEPSVNSSSDLQSPQNDGYAIPRGLPSQKGAYAVPRPVSKSEESIVMPAKPPTPTISVTEEEKLLADADTDAGKTDSSSELQATGKNAYAVPRVVPDHYAIPKSQSEAGSTRPEPQASSNSRELTANKSECVSPVDTKPIHLERDALGVSI